MCEVLLSLPDRIQGGSIYNSIKLPMRIRKKEKKFFCSAKQERSNGRKSIVQIHLVEECYSAGAVHTRAVLYTSKENIKFFFITLESFDKERSTVMM